MPLWRVAIFAILVIATFGAVSAPRATARSNDGVFGVNAGDLFKLPPSQWDSHLGAMAADGIQVVRLGAWWSDLEPAPPIAWQHNYYWGDVDQQVAALARHGLRWEPLICFSPTWDSMVPGDYTAAPASAADFAAFAAALAQRYGNGGSFWREHPELPALPVRSYELWNEQNAAVFWHPAKAAPEYYADLYAAAHAAIHHVDAGARVVVGGLAAKGRRVVPADQFIRRMLVHRPELRGKVDAVALHPYAHDVAGVYASLAAFRRALDSLAGPGVPIELTEIGWTTSDTAEARRAANLNTLATTLPRSDCGVDRFMPYVWVGPEQATNDREQWFGIENRDATPKPSATAFARAVLRMRGIAGTPPAGGVRICRAAKLRIRVRQDRRRADRLLLVAHCPSGCRLRVAVLAPSDVRIARRSTRFTSRRQELSLKVGRRRGTELRVMVTAIGRRGSRMRSDQTITLR